MIDAETRALATRVLDACRARKLMVATAESCTGGLVAGALTEIAGSSDVVDRGFVTYSNAAKMAMLGVPEATLAPAWRGEPPDRARRWRAARSRAPASTSPWRSPASPAPAAARPRSRSASCISRRPPSDGGLIHREKRYGDIGR